MAAIASWYHCSVKPVSRSAGRSVVAAAAYRLGEKFYDRTYDKVQDYTRKRGVEATFTIAPQDAPQWAHDPESLWNAAERAETRKNSTLAREVELALPSFLSPQEREQIVECFSAQLVERYNVAVSVAIHEPGERGDDRNYHAHILFTTREMTPEGLGKKTRILDDRATGPGEVVKLRELAADIINASLAAANADIRVDHRSFKDRGIEREPTTHLGPAATEMERRGEATERGEMTRQAEAINASFDALNAVGMEIQAEQERQAGPAQDVADARERVRDAVAPFVEAIETQGEVPNLEADGLTWWQRAAMRAFAKTRDLTLAMFTKAREYFRDRGIER